MNIIKTANVLLFGFLFIATQAFAIPEIDRQSFLDLSDSIAFEFGRVYQMGHNCDKNIKSMSPPQVAGLFINYMDETAVQKTMQNYFQGLNSKKKLNVSWKS